MNNLIEDIKKVCKNINEDSPFMFKLVTCESIRNLAKLYPSLIKIDASPTITEDGEKMLKITITNKSTSETESFLVDFF